jgi:hypothetical protein
MQRLLIAALTVVVFAAGFMARMWTERDRPVPPPPVSLGEEFKTPRGPQTAESKAKDRSSKDAVNRSRLIADIEKVRPQIEAYRKRIDEIDGEFDRDFMAILSAEQRERYLARQKRMAEGRAKRDAREAADTSPLSDEQILRLQQFPLFDVLWKVAITARLERLTRDMKLDEAQVAKSRALLITRRDKFLLLVDNAPPPTITLSELARQTRKLAEPGAPAQEPAKRHK